MAQDNAAQAIKDLQKNLEAADKKLKDLIESFEKFGKKSSKSQEYKENLAKIAHEYEEIKKKVDALSGSTDRLNKKQEQQNKQTKDEKANVDKLIPSVQKLAAAFGLAFSVRGLVQFGKKLIETRGEFELQQVALRSILQNKQLADEIWDKTMQQALKSPFKAMQLVTYTKQLAAYRIETEKLFDTTKRLADVSAGLGVDMGRLILAYGQVKAANFLRASEIRQFTEAGVNILGELSKYLSQTNGKFISTAQVMDMVQKRMVTFEDVATIFKNLTDEGGIFYNMQYVQSQTVKGQIMKLHDAYDQMLNNIGKANQGVLKDLVSALNNIVKNWREWKTVLDLIAWPVIISMLAKFSRGLFVSATAAKLARNNVIGLEKAGTKLQLTLKKLLTTISTNPWILLATAIAAATVAAINHAKAAKAVNDEYDELAHRTVETQSKLSDIEKTINKNNEILSDPKRVKEHNDAQKENAELIARLKEEYPQLADAMTINTNGIIAMGDAMERYNNELELNLRLAELSKASFFDESLKTDISDYEKGIQTQQDIFEQYRQKAEDYLLLYKKELYEAEEAQKENLGLYGFADPKLEANINHYKDIVHDLTEILNAKNIEEFNKALENLPSLESLKRMVQSGWSYGASVYISEFAPITKPISGESELKNELEQNMSAYEKYLVKMAKLNKDFKWDEKDWALPDTVFLKKYNKEIQDMLFTVDPETQEVVIGQLGKDLSHVFIAASEQATTELGKKGIMQILLKLLKERDNLDLNVDYGSGEGGGGNTQPEKPEKTKETASKLISLIREMRSEYDKLSKSAYGYAKSEATVRESYKDSVKEILGKAGITDYDFTTNEGMIAALEKVKTYATKLGKDAAAEVQKYIDQLETEIQINAQVKIRENFVKDIEDMFNDYQLTLELQQLNISPEAARDLFPEFDAQSLGQLQDALNDFYKKQGASFDEEDLKVYKQWSDKVDAEILKSRKERAKEYSKYLEKEYSERAKVEMQYAKDVAFVSANFKGEQQQNILKGIKDKYQQDLSELTWKSFKESAFYVEMMDDLSSVPMDYMKTMLGKIEELLANPQTLSPRALKEAINARQKILEAQMDFDQVAVMKESMEEIHAAATSKEGVGGKTWRDTKKRLDEEQKAQAEKLKGLEEEIRCYEELQGQLKGLEQHDEAVAAANMALPEDVVSMLEGTDIDTLISQYSSELESLSVSEDATTSAEKDENAQIQAKIEYLQRVIPLLEAYRTALNARAAYQETDAGQNALFARQGGETSTSVGATITETKGEANKTSNKLATLKKWQKAFTNFNNSFARFNKNAADMVGRLGSLASAAFDLYDALGGETDAMTEAWKEFGSTIVNVITQALTMIPSLVAGFVTAGTTINAAMGIIGLIAEAIQLVLVLIGALAKLHDAGYEKEIENQQKKIDSLQRAYERLEKAIEKTWDTASYIRTYNEETQNLYDRIEATNRQIAAEQAKKNSDADKIQGYKDSIQDMEDELDELKQKQIEVFGGIGREAYRDAASEFVDAWKSAFLETGDGLQGLQDHFDEFLQSWFTKQATMRIAGRMLEPLFSQIDQAVDQYGAGGTDVLMSELGAIRERFSIIAPQLSEALEQLAGSWGLDGQGGLSGLAAGIQGMTEEQANILEAYWNSVRGYTASIDMNVARIADILGVGGVNTNPLLAQMVLVANNTNGIHTLLQSVTTSGHGLGGYGIKVFAN